MRESMAGPSAIPRGCDAFNRKLALVVGQVTDFCVFTATQSDARRAAEAPGAAVVSVGRPEAQAAWRNYCLTRNRNDR